MSVGVIRRRRGVAAAKRRAAASTFPQRASEVGSTNISGTSHTVTYPSGIAAGNLLLMCFAIAQTTATVTLPAGWTSISDQAGPSSLSQLVVATRTASGSESGTFTVTTSVAVTSAARVLRITGAHASTAPEVSTGATGSTTAPNPTSLNPTNWGTENTLWLAVFGARVGNTTISAYPSGYTSGTDDRFSTSTGAHLGMASLESAVASEDPGAFTTVGAVNWIAATIGVRPA